MITFETIGKLELATLKEGDLVQVLGEFSEGDVALMTGKVYPALHNSSNRLVTIANGLKVEVFPTPLGDKDVTKKYVNERDDKIKEQVNNLHTKRDAIEWKAGLRVTDELQLYVHDGVEYLPDSEAVPFTTGNSFADDMATGRFSEESIAVNIKSTENFGVTNVIDSEAMNITTTCKTSELVIEQGVHAIETLPKNFGQIKKLENNLLSENKDNLLQTFSEVSTQSQLGLINSGSLYNSSFYNAVKYKKHVKIVLVGDSIGVGNDMSNKTILPGAQGWVDVGVDNPSTASALYMVLFNELCTSVPNDVRVDLFVRCIGGKSYWHLDKEPYAEGANWVDRTGYTKGDSWRQAVVNIKPDLVIHEHGMNQNNKNYLVDFKEKWVDWLDLQGLTNTFDQAILTTPNPSFTISDATAVDYRDFDYNAGKFYVQQQQFEMSRKYGYSLIDVARISYLCRYGIDVRNNTTLNDSTPMTFSNGATSYRIPNDNSFNKLKLGSNAIYGVYSFSVTSNTTFTQSPQHDLRFNIGEVEVRFIGGYCQIKTTKIVGYEFLSSHEYSLPAGTTSIEITVAPSGVLVKARTRLIAWNDNPAYTDTLGVNVVSGSISGVTLDVECVSLYSQLFGSFGISQTDWTMWGTHHYTHDGGRFGGGMNHPSALNLINCYAPAIREFLTSSCAVPPVKYGCIVPNAQNTSLYVGTVEPLRSNKASMKFSNGCYIEIGLDTNGALYQGSSYGVDFVVTPDLKVYLKNTPSVMTCVERNGVWRRTESRIAPAIPSGREFTDAVGNKIIGAVLSCESYKTNTTATITDQTLIYKSPYGFEIVSISAQCGLNKAVVSDVMDDKVQTAFLGRDAQIKYVFDPLFDTHVNSYPRSLTYTATLKPVI